MFWIQHSLISTENIMTLALDVTGDVGVLIRSHLQQPLLSWWHQLTGRVISCTAASAKLSEYQAKHGATQKLVHVHQQRARALNIKVNESSDNNIFSLSERHYQPRMCSLNTINLDSESEFHVFVWLWCRKIILQRCISFKQIKINDFHLYQSLHESQILPNSSF